MAVTPFEPVDPAGAGAAFSLVNAGGTPTTGAVGFNIEGVSLLGRGIEGTEVEGAGAGAFSRVNDGGTPMTGDVGRENEGVPEEPEGEVLLFGITGAGAGAGRELPEEPPELPHGPDDGRELPDDPEDPPNEPELEGRELPEEPDELPDEPPRELELLEELEELLLLPARPNADVETINDNIRSRAELRRIRPPE